MEHKLLPEQQFLTAMTVVFLIIIGYNILSLIGNFILFGKIGKPRYLGLMPVVNDFVIFKTFWNVKMFFVYLVLYIFYYISSVSNFKFNAEANLILSIGLLAIIITLMEKIRKAFNKNFLWTIGLIVCYPLFIILLAYKGEMNIEHHLKKADI